MRQYMHQQRLQTVPFSNRSSIAGQRAVVKGCTRSSIDPTIAFSKDTIPIHTNRYLNPRKRRRAEFPSILTGGGKGGRRRSEAGKRWRSDYSPLRNFRRVFGDLRARSGF